MASIPTPNYVLTEDQQVWVGSRKTLMAGSFVRPIDEIYLPQHVKDYPEYKWFNSERQVHVYSSLGIVTIDISAMRRV